MGCLFAITGGLFPRLAVLLLWLARPAMFNSVFGGSVLLPVVGIIFLPFTTLTYTLLAPPVMGIVGFDWVWVILAFALDLGGYGSTGYANRDRFARRRA